MVGQNIPNLDILKMRILLSYNREISIRILGIMIYFKFVGLSNSIDWILSIVLGVKSCWESMKPANFCCATLWCRDALRNCNATITIILWSQRKISFCCFLRLSRFITQSNARCGSSSAGRCKAVHYKLRFPCGGV